MTSLDVNFYNDVFLFLFLSNSSWKMFSFGWFILFLVVTFLDSDLRCNGMEFIFLNAALFPTIRFQFQNKLPRSQKCILDDIGHVVELDLWLVIVKQETNQKQSFGYQRNPVKPDRTHVDMDHWPMRSFLWFWRMYLFFSRITSETDAMTVMGKPHFISFFFKPCNWFKSAISLRTILRLLSLVLQPRNVIPTRKARWLGRFPETRRLIGGRSVDGQSAAAFRVPRMIASRERPRKAFSFDTEEANATRPDRTRSDYEILRFPWSENNPTAMELETEPPLGLISAIHLRQSLRNRRPERNDSITP